MATYTREMRDKHKFIVEIDRVKSAGFQKCSELSIEFAEIQYFEGGTIIPFKNAGRATVADVTLERGTASNLDFWEWVKHTNNAAISVPNTLGFGSGAPLAQYKSEDTAVIQLDRDNTRLVEYPLINPWPKKFVAGDWDNTADAVVVESLTLGIDRFDIVPL